VPLQAIHLTITIDKASFYHILSQKTAAPEEGHFKQVLQRQKKQCLIACVSISSS